MRKLLVLLLMVQLFFVGPLVISVHAGGIPTFDGVNLSQGMIRYIQSLLDYLEQTAQLEAQEGQYVVQVQQYLRDLEEYEHYLKQAQALEQVIDSGDWDTVLRDVENYYGESGWSMIPNTDVRTEAGRLEVRGIVETGYSIPKKTADEIAYWQGRITGYEMPDYEQKRHDRDEAHIQRMLDRQYSIAENQRGITSRKDAVDKYMKKAGRLGDDSELQTQQLMAQEMAYLLSQQEVLIGRVNQLLSAQETHSEYAAARDYEIRKAAHEKQEKLQSNNLPSTLGTDIWKKF